MKKTLVALAALASVSAFAQSSVTISGVIDSGYKTVDTTGTKGDTKGMASNGTATTVLTLAGTEDLGKGLKANFKMQLTPDFLTGNGVASSTVMQASGTATADGQNLVGNAQEVFVGLQGNFGQVKVGRVNTNALDAWGVGSVTGTALGSGYGSNGNIFTRYSSSAPVSGYQTAPTRFNNAIRWESNSINGFSGSIFFVPKVNTTGGTVASVTTSTAAVSTNRQGVTDLGLKYSNGPMNLMYASQKISTGSLGIVDAVAVSGAAAIAANGNNTVNIFSGNYNLGATTVYAATWTEKGDGTVVTTNATGTMAGVKYNMGQIDLLATTGKNRDNTSSGVHKRVSGYGADYNLSKNTALYGRYESRNSDSTTADTTTKSLMAGIRLKY